jgi:pyruvate/2-oxoglutarate dehydrogenase complex dihydrolipoamide acyltransferase (E2) component
MSQGVTVSALLAKAVGLALAKHPIVNSNYVENGTTHPPLYHPFPPLSPIPPSITHPPLYVCAQGVTVSALLAKAVGLALAKHPIVNSNYVDNGINYNADVDHPPSLPDFFPR